MAHLYDGIEKREFLRVDYATEMEFALCHKNELEAMPAGMTKNISACGILFVAKTAFPIGHLLVICLDWSTLSNVVEIDDSVIEVNQWLLGRVVRVEEYHIDKQFGMGVCFVRKNEADDEDDIQQVIKLLERQPKYQPQAKPKK